MDRLCGELWPPDAAVNDRLAGVPVRTVCEVGVAITVRLAGTFRTG